MMESNHRLEKTQPNWFEHWFDRDEYKLVYRHRDDDEARRVVSFIEDSIRPAAGSRILDIGCGRGRHSILLSKHGYDVTGIDLSERSIHEARESARDAGTNAEFVVADMRDPHCGGCMDGVVNLFTAFGYFDDEADHQRALDAMSESLKPGGWFLQDFLNADHVRSDLVPRTVDTFPDGEIEQRRTIADGRINKRICIRHFSDASEKVFEESVRLFDLSDLDRMHRKAGLVLKSVCGDYAGGPFTPVSPRLILISTKRID